VCIFNLQITNLGLTPNYFQIELNLKCALECHQQTAASNRYMPIPPIPSRMDTPASGNVEFLNYPQYIATTKQQIQFSQEVRQVSVL
jgi:hypothetical protein